MKNVEKLFTIDHDKLFNIAWWANLVAWIVPAVYILSAAGRFFELQYTYLFSNPFNQPPNCIKELETTPLYGASVLLDLLSILLKGAVYFLVLKGISLGLSMILETDINYRDEDDSGGGK